MRNLFILVAIMFCPTFVNAQLWDFEKPDYKAIEVNIQQEDSPFYYADLLARYKSADTNMSLEEKRHLYYGFSFQPEYAPYERSPYSDSLRTIGAKNALTPRDLELMLQHSDFLLNQNPFDVEALNYRLLALEKMEDPERFNVEMNKMGIIVEVLISSGNGENQEDAFYVIDTTHEYFLLSVLGLQFDGMQSLIDQCDYLTIKENDLGLEGMYFNVSRCLNSMLSNSTD